MATATQVQDLKSVSPLAWAELNNFVNENQQPLDYDTHRFLIEPFNDFHPDQTTRKSAQVGYSVMEILKAVWACDRLGLNIGYVLPSHNLVKDFVSPKVDPLISSNPEISKLVSNKKDSLTVKQIGDRFLYFRGAFSEREAIAISLDALLLDELDRMPDPTVINVYDSRLQASQFAWRWRFSNPSVPGYGVDYHFKQSDQKHWFVKCPHCNHEWYINWAKSDEKNHYVDQVKKIYACGKCGKALPDEDRRMGRWVAKYPKRDKRGYWISQLMAPWVSAVRVVEQFEESSPEFFHNFVLGLAFQAEDLSIGREAILRATSPSSVAKRDVVMGIDNGVVKTWVAGTPDGIFAHGKTESWSDIERMIIQWGAVAVIDPNPYPTDPKRLVDKYKGRVYICYFKKDTKNLSMVQWGTGDKSGVVYADRTKLMDLVSREISDQQIIFRESPHQLEDYIAQWESLYRITEESDKGQVRTDWVKRENQAVDYPFATAYYRLGLAQVLTGPKAYSDESTISERPQSATEIKFEPEGEKMDWKHK